MGRKIGDPEFTVYFSEVSTDRSRLQRQKKRGACAPPGNHVIQEEEESYVGEDRFALPPKSFPEWSRTLSP